MPDLKALSRQYVAAFHEKDVAAVAALLAEDFVLIDPTGRFEGKPRVLTYLREIFADGATLDFRARNIFEDGTVTVIEFALQIGGKQLVGTDVIEWQGGQMRALRAYLY